MKNTPGSGNPCTPRAIREKFREVFGCEAGMSDDVLLQRYRISGDGDLIMILR